MAALAQDLARPDHPGQICRVISSRPDAGGLARARAFGLCAGCIDHRAFASRGDFETALDADLRAYGVEILCLAGFMRVLTPGFIALWAGRMLNIHPSILPLFPGLHTHSRALAAGMAVHGATVHEVTAALDAGPILGQAVIPIHDGDTPTTLAARLLPLEHRLYPQALRRFIAGERARFLLTP